MAGNYPRLTPEKEKARMAFIRAQLEQGIRITTIKKRLIDKFGRGMHYQRIQEIRDSMGLNGSRREAPELALTDTERAGLVPARCVSERLRMALADIVELMKLDGVLRLTINLNGNVDVVYSPEEGSFEVKHG